MSKPDYLSIGFEQMDADLHSLLEAFAEVEARGLSGDEAVMAAFEMNKNDASRTGGN